MCSTEMGPSSRTWQRGPGFHEAIEFSSDEALAVGRFPACLGGTISCAWPKLWEEAGKGAEIGGRLGTFVIVSHCSGQDVPLCHLCIKSQAILPAHIYGRGGRACVAGLVRNRSGGRRQSLIQKLRSETGLKIACGRSVRVCDSLCLGYGISI